MYTPFPINPIQISWVTFGVINIPTTLMAFRILKPAPMKRFRRDVLDYVVTAGVIGAVSMCALYAVSYLVHGEDVTRARSGVIVFMTLFSVIVFWDVCGLNMFQPRTVAAKPRLFVLGIVLALITIFAPYIVPDFVEVVQPTAGEWALNILVFLLAAALINTAMRKRSFTNALWELTSP
jgi:magnesium-transporting ATPase (P-type)